MAKLKHTRDSQVFVIDIDEDYTVIGRSRACDITVPGVTDLSREHCCICRQPQGHYTIKDLGSTNGTFVNGNRIKTEVTLTDGDRIRLGKAATFVFIAADRMSIGEGETDMDKTMMFGTDTSFSRTMETVADELSEKSYHSLMEDIVKSTRKRPPTG